MKCNTCGKEEPTLYRVVLAADYNAIIKMELWNCKECYDKKNKEREKLR